MGVDELLSGDYAIDPGPLDEYAEFLARGAHAVTRSLDACLDEFSQGWAVSRMPACDRNLLRLALFEMLCVDDVDISVTIDEAVILSQAFGTDESPRFVNGLLGRVADEIEERGFTLDAGEAGEDEDEDEGEAAPAVDDEKEADAYGEDD